MPKHKHPMPKETFTFALVEYHKYDPPKVNCRYYRHVEGYGTLTREMNSWKEIFDELKSFHKDVKFEIPDEIPVIKIGKDGKEFK